MTRNFIIKLLFAATLALPWLATSTGCTYYRRDDRGWERREWQEHHDWDDHPGDRRVYDPHYDRH